MKKNRQLKFEDRVKLELFIKEDVPVSQISKKLSISKQTIYREIQRNCIVKKWNVFGRIKCANFNECSYRIQSHLNCSRECDRYIPYECSKLKRFPFVCNNCNKKTYCRDKHLYYYANYANEIANKRLHDSRKGIRISQEEFNQINNIISPLIIDKGQSLNHILSAHKEIKVSERTLRNWINKGFTDAKNINLPRKVSFKPSKEYIHRITKPSNVIDGRTYKDYKKFIKDNPDLLVCQIDTVEGKKTDSFKILTLHFPALHFQFGILIKNITSSKVNRTLLELRNMIGFEEWKRIFPILLTDNGIEFNELYLIENDSITGEHLSNVYYCDPYCSSQKGSCERNHEFIRYIEPKYHTFEHLNQAKVNLIFSHINSLYRQSLNGIRPIDLAVAILGKNFLETIGIKKIEPDFVNLTQSLTKNIKHS